MYLKCVLLLHTSPTSSSCGRSVAKSQRFPTDNESFSSFIAKKRGGGGSHNSLLSILIAPVWLLPFEILTNVYKTMLF